MSGKDLPPLLDRHWAESALAIGAVIIAAVSLWVAWDTERTNRELVASEQQLVAANSWPYVQIEESDLVPGGAPDSGMTLAIANQGIGPAKLETFEVFWKGAPQQTLDALLRSCSASSGGAGGETAMISDADVGYGATHGLVLRPGQVQNFLIIPRNAHTGAALAALGSGLKSLSFRYCYCSAFNDCWLVQDDFGRRPTLNPPRVHVCPRPKVSYR